MAKKSTFKPYTKKSKRSHTISVLRAADNLDYFNYLKANKEKFTTTKSRREELISHYKVTKSRANDISKRV